MYKAEIFCDDTDSCSNLNIFVNQTSSITINCQYSSSCDHITTHISNLYYTPTPTLDPVALQTDPTEIPLIHSLSSYLIPHCKLSWNCLVDGCSNNTNKIIIDTGIMNENHIQCNIYNYNLTTIMQQ